MTEASPGPPSGFDLARQWSEAPALLPHSSGCACAGHAGLHLDPAAVEADVLDYLGARYERDGPPELVTFIEHRRQQRGLTFASWLIGLDSAALSEPARARLLTDLAATLSSLARAR